MILVYLAIKCVYSVHSAWRIYVLIHHGTKIGLGLKIKLFVLIFGLTSLG